VKINPDAWFVLAVAAIIAAAAPRVLAQGSGPRQGSNGLFGGPSDAKAHQKLDLTLSSTQGYDSEMLPDVGAPIGLGGPESTGYSTMVVGAADYVWQVSRVQVRASGTSALRYNRPLDNPLYSSFRSVSHTAGVGIFARLPKRTTMLINQTATYSPSFLFNLFPQAEATIPGDAPPAALDYAMNGSESRSYGTAMTLTHDFTPRSSLLATADYQNTETFGAVAGRRALGTYGIRAHFARRLSPNTAAIAEYLYRSSEGAASGGVTSAQASGEHGVNVGMDYSRRLSASRRLTFGALIGSSITIVPESAVAGPEPEPAVSESGVSESGAQELAGGPAIGDRYYRRMSGQVTMGYEFARSWKAGAIYRRGVDYVIGLNEPIAADRFTATVEGLLTRRVNVLASAGYSNGESALTLQRSTFNTYTGDVRLRYALTRTFAAYVEYLYYVYDSRGSTPIAPGIFPSLERKGVRTGLTLLVPALRR
jgi:hypothetical protein